MFDSVYDLPTKLGDIMKGMILAWDMNEMQLLGSLSTQIIASTTAGLGQESSNAVYPLTVSVPAPDSIHSTYTKEETGKHELNTEKYRIIQTLRTVLR